MSVHVFRSLPLEADSRTKRNANIFSKRPDDTKIYTWEKSEGVNPNGFPFLKSGSKLHKAIKFFLFVFWVPLVILFKVKKGDIVVLMDLETAVLGLFAAKVKRGYVIFDIVDPMSQTKLTMFEGTRLNKVVDWIELQYSRIANMALVPHECRIKYYEDRLGKKISSANFQIVENVPSYNSKLDPVTKLDVNKVVIGYFGTLDFNSRGLEFLISLAQHNTEKVRVIIAGQGGMAEYLTDMASEIPNLEFKGGFDQLGLVSLYNSVDYTWAFYSSEIPLHKYAAPNKFYEHLYFEKPIITTRITPQSELIESLNSGVIIDDNYPEVFNEDNILNLILGHNSRFQESDRVAISDYWEKNYNDYYSKVIRRIRDAM